MLEQDGGFALSDLPSTEREELAAHFDEWVCDDRIKMSGIIAFTGDAGNIGKPYLNKYMVFKTSGTTGVPLITLYDRRTLNVFRAVRHSRKFARKEDFKPYRNTRIAYVCIRGFHMANGLCYAKEPVLSLMGNKKKLVDQSKPIHEMVQALNQYKPDSIISFPSTFKLLADECRAGRLRISPSLIAAAGEDLSDEACKNLAEAFGCHVHRWYISTEGGVIASECASQRYHLNEDWVIIEPLDSNGNHVPDGQFSDKLLLTNLSNLTQPFIRYEISDRVALHTKEPCPCGNPAPWVEIEGRCDEVACFDTPNGKVRVTPWLFHSHLMGKTEIRSYQSIVKSGNVIELRLDANDRSAVFARVSEPIRQSLMAMGADVSIKLPDDLPQADASGKMRCVINQ
ncbi:MAG: phenylacetate--CoA ligase family protein [Oscillospiraceae bacterium]|nr:phenylacetate--CoA ligase family protein [Oscillospiraceae bacterium]